MKRLGVGVVGLLLLAASQAKADFFSIPLPDTQYTGSTTLLSFPEADGVAVASVTDGILTVTLPGGVTARTVPGGGWATWGSPPFTEGATPRVIGAVALWTLTFSTPVKVFGFEAEPNPFAVHCISAHFYSGSTLIGVVSRNINGNAGALLAAGSTTDTFTSVVVSSTPTFAIGRLRYSTSFYHPPPHSSHGHTPLATSHGGYFFAHHGQHGHVAALGCQPEPGHTSLGLSEAAEDVFVVALNEDGVPNGNLFAQNDHRAPARRGSTLRLFGSAAGLKSPAESAKAWRVLVGDVPAKITHSGLAVGLQGIWQVNFVVPEEAPVGTAVPLTVFHGANPLRSISVAIE